MAHPHPDPTLEDQLQSNPDSPPPAQDDDARSDIEQAVSARSDALERGEGGKEIDAMTDPGAYNGVSSTGGEVKNQDDTQQ